MCGLFAGTDTAGGGCRCQYDRLRVPNAIASSRGGYTHCTSNWPTLTIRWPFFVCYLGRSFDQRTLCGAAGHVEAVRALCIGAAWNAELELEDARGQTALQVSSLCWSTLQIAVICPSARFASALSKRVPFALRLR